MLLSLQRVNGQKTIYYIFLKRIKYKISKKNKKQFLLNQKFVKTKE